MRSKSSVPAAPGLTLVRTGRRPSLGHVFIIRPPFLRHGSRMGGTGGDGEPQSTLVLIEVERM